VQNRGCEPQTAASKIFPLWNGKGRTTVDLPSSGTCRLTDGTGILASGENDALGDPIQRTVKPQGRDVTFDAIGVAAVRFDQSGRVEALAAGGLKTFKTGDLSIELATRVDVALWKNARGKWRGVLQDYEGAVPEALGRITENWMRLTAPKPLRSAD
jgi:hypothetical protein